LTRAKYKSNIEKKTALSKHNVKAKIIPTRKVEQKISGKSSHLVESGSDISDNSSESSDMELDSDDECSFQSENVKSNSSCLQREKQISKTKLKLQEADINQSDGDTDDDNVDESDGELGEDDTDDESDGELGEDDTDDESDGELGEDDTDDDNVDGEEQGTFLYNLMENA
jgi:hypothetical protein